MMFKHTPLDESKPKAVAELFSKGHTGSGSGSGSGDGYGDGDGSGDGYEELRETNA